MDSGDGLDPMAEAYYLIASEANRDLFVISCEGTRLRPGEMEVIGWESITPGLSALKVCLNGLYHFLPQSLFIPFTLGSLSADTDEIKEKIRENRQTERDAIRFFAPFDTELFLTRAELLRRHLGWPHNREEKIISELCVLLSGRKINFHFTRGGQQEKEATRLWFSLLLSIQDAKENRQLLSQYISAMLGWEVIIVEILKPIAENTEVALGQGHLGVDTLLGGSPASEWADWKFHMVVPSISDLHLIMIDEGITFRDHIIQILSYFCLAQRDIYIEFSVLHDAVWKELESGYLGINTYLSAAS